MAFCKVCACGEKIIFERRLSFPDNCPACGRKLVDFLTYNEDDPRVEKLIKDSAVSEKFENEETHTTVESNSNKKRYILKLDNGKEIRIPDEGGIIGRTGIGAEELAEYQSVSRQHLRVTPRRNIGILVEDISTYGTLVDGQRIVKNSPVRVAEGAKVTLTNVNVVLKVEEVSV
ncbi:FHA domain-containing protein [Eshraghiella crossota]|uniref:FHA domain protein n=1 Tax=Eshraghiella crossota DSM 2876 TaxID=511680 RepID=D4RXQ4_9FIRM|nr:FHA domain-containing protein [Butyrivibrio crossotus]EFF69136.1 FHA domain protein [Butyrivibrio crossotus DSM 2876]UWO50596.1 FHA domain-containing protein [Butyrivibrio crossotus]